MQERGLVKTPKLTPAKGSGAVSPDALQTILLDEIAGRLADLTEIQKALGALTLKMEKEMQKVAQGRMIPFTMTIPTPDRNIGLKLAGDYLWWNFQDFTGVPAVSATFFNDGPSSVFVCMNDIRDGFQELLNGEHLHFDYAGHPVIKQFFLKVNTGGTANLRIPLEF